MVGKRKMRTCEEVINRTKQSEQTKVNKETGEIN